MPNKDSSAERWWGTKQAQPRMGVCRRCLGDGLNNGDGWYHTRPQAHVEDPHYFELSRP